MPNASIKLNLGSQPQPTSALKFDGFFFLPFLLRIKDFGIWAITKSQKYSHFELRIKDKV